MNAQMLQYSRLPHNMFTDTLFANIKSKAGNKCAQPYAMNFVLVQVHPMATKGDAHDALSLMLQCDSVPFALIVDNS